MAQVVRMVTTSFKTEMAEETASIAKEQEKDSLERKSLSTVFFLSYDIVNSTEFKIRSPDTWQNVVKNFYKLAISDTKRLIPGCSVWKKAGDEVLLYFQIHEPSGIINTIENIASTQALLRSRFKSETHTRGILDVKATLWSAQVGRSDAPNLILSETDGSLDFIGPEIDFGFRLTTCSAPGILVVDPKIVWILENQAENTSNSSQSILKHTRLISYETLKGVWNNRYIPIYWYHPIINSPTDILPFDEFKRNHLANSLLEGKTKSISLKKIGKDLGVIDSWDQLISTIGKGERIGQSPVESNKQAEIHLVAICINDEAKILCGKRLTSKQRFPGMWEFGCTQLYAGADTIFDIIASEYLTDFGVSIRNLIGETNAPTPIATFGFRENDQYGRWIPGIIFVASGTGITHESSEKYSEMRWLSIDEIDRIEETASVSNFHKNAKLAIELFTREIQSAE
jgi:hypothetical protein